MQNITSRTKVTTPRPLFSLGQISISAGALGEIMARFDEDPDAIASRFLTRHVEGEWGGMSEPDQARNRRACKSADRILSGFDLPPFDTDGAPKRLWVITAMDRSSTQIILPEERFPGGKFRA